MCHIFSALVALVGRIDSKPLRDAQPFSVLSASHGIPRIRKDWSMRAQGIRCAAWTCGHCGSDVPAGFAHKCCQFETAISDAAHLASELRWYAHNWPEKRLLADTCRRAAALIESLVPASAMSTGTAETQSGSGLQPASPTAKPGRPEAPAHPPQPE
jgi:hypothetical protein